MGSFGSKIKEKIDTKCLKSVITVELPYHAQVWEYPPWWPTQYHINIPVTGIKLPLCAYL